MRLWADVPGWEGRYEVSNDGLVRSWWYGKKTPDYWKRTETEN